MLLVHVNRIFIVFSLVVVVVYTKQYYLGRGALYCVAVYSRGVPVVDILMPNRFSVGNHHQYKIFKKRHHFPKWLAAAPNEVFLVCSLAILLV